MVLKPPRHGVRLLAKFFVGLLCGLVLSRQSQTLLAIADSTRCPTNPLPAFLPDETPHQAMFPSTGPADEPATRQFLLVGVMTADKYIKTRAKAVFETWGRWVPGKILFFTADGTDMDPDLPIVRLRGVDDSYPPQKKSFLMLKYLHEHYGNKFEWFMRADDDIFVKTERLELFLKNINSSKPYFIGQAGQGIQVSQLIDLQMSGDIPVFPCYRKSSVF